MTGFPEGKYAFSCFTTSTVFTSLLERKWPVQYSLNISVGPAELHVWLELERPVSYVWLFSSLLVILGKSVTPGSQKAKTELGSGPHTRTHVRTHAPITMCKAKAALEGAGSVCNFILSVPRIKMARVLHSRPRHSLAPFL